jgi:hypothetical protein
MTIRVTFVDVLRRDPVGRCYVGMLLRAASAQTLRPAESGPETSRATSDPSSAGSAEMTALPPAGQGADSGSPLPRNLSALGHVPETAGRLRRPAVRSRDLALSL